MELVEDNEEECQCANDVANVVGVVFSSTDRRVDVAWECASPEETATKIERKNVDVALLMPMMTTMTVTRAVRAKRNAIVVARDATIFSGVPTLPVVNDVSDVAESSVATRSCELVVIGSFLVTTMIAAAVAVEE